ncbi:flagellin [SAR116 cluster bacterium]|nr:flagellin [SAR116 cluster bacterium]
MVSVNTNIAALSSHNALTGTKGDFENSMLRLSTGKKINGAADDAAGLSIANSMTAQIKGLKMASKNASDAISLTTTVEGALQESTNILQRMRELAVQATSDTNSGQDRVFIQDEINQLNNELNRIANTTEFNGIKVLNGTFTDKTIQVGNLGSQTISVGVENADNNTLGAYQLESVDESVTAASATALTTAIDALNAAAADYTVKGFFGTKTASVDAGATARDTAAAFNLVSSTTGIKATAITKARLAASAAATYTFSLIGKSSTVSTVTATITATTDLTALKDAINSVSGSTGIVATLTSDKAGINITQDEGYNIIINDVTTGTTTANITVKAMERDGTVDGTTRTLAGITTAGDCAGVLGQVILSGDKPFTVTPGNAANSFSAATGELSSSLSTVGNISIKTVSGATNAIAVLDGALSMISASRSKMGALENRLNATVDNLSTIITKTEQARSRVLDADMASETTALSKSQILQQASTAMLAQANQANQGVLQLLQA